MMKAIGRAARAASLCVIVAGGALAQGRTFVAEGTDVAQGVGGRYLAMASTGAAFADDPHALFYNPALIAGFDRPMVTVTRQGNAKLRPYTFVGVTTPFPILEPLGWASTIGFASYPRVHTHSTGAFRANDPQSIFLRMLLPGVSGTYDGEIDSKTLVWRWAMGFQPLNDARLKVGLMVDRIDCKTNSCGVHAGSVGREVKSVHATAFSVGAGISYDLSDRIRLAAAVNDIDTQLSVVTYTRDGAGVKWYRWQVALPRTVQAEVSWRASDRLLLAAGFKSMHGSYGSYDLTINTVNFGAEYRFDNGLAVRAGAWRPTKIASSNGLNANLPFPVAPTFGAGWKNDRFAADVAIYAHPIMSFHYGRPAPTVDLTLSYRF
ncbi:outer membrane protein transport protein [Maritimibacter dapengensis]|uniref:Outer membrane protein transport protein n=1 Tax=Maritimibacter dapengensis TaxID=2836868 RepID=A0ABS6SYC8_9RHOB|nr:outer membrane protein transport protein [Maritimibacter dapengensis]MBV7377978.1 outer membrane protein transport protein [Maritimibacter dapengensis]